MNNLILMLGFLCHFQNDTTCQERFLLEVFKDTTNHKSKFIVLNVIDSVGTKQKIILGNHSFYLSFKHYRSMSYPEYQKYVVEKVKSGKSFEYEDYKPIKGYVTVTKDKYVDYWFKKGKQEFLEHFFIKKRLFKMDYYSHFNAIISKLFEMGMLLSQVDNGYLVIVYELQCDLNSK